ncbi:MAG TPA: DUF4255 domain-containing protein [Ilumatobacter sp.]
MLDLIDDTLEELLRATVPLGATEVDVSFDPPDREWSAKLTRPTVNLFLWDIRLSASRSRSGLEEFVSDGQVVRRMALPVVELRYLVTAWTSDHGDERVLLSGLLRSLTSFHEIPGAYVPAGLSGLRPLVMMVARSGEDQIDIFKTLEGQLKPGIHVVVACEVDTGVTVPAGPPTTGFLLSVKDGGRGATSKSRRVAGEVMFEVPNGTIARSPGASVKVNPTGRFLLRAKPGDEIVLDVDPPRTAIVPENGGVRFE